MSLGPAPSRCSDAPGRAWSAAGKGVVGCQREAGRRHGWPGACGPGGSCRRTASRCAGAPGGCGAATRGAGRWPGATGQPSSGCVMWPCTRWRAGRARRAGPRPGRARQLRPGPGHHRPGATPPSWSNATRPGGQSRSCSNRAGRSPGSARPATPRAVPFGLLCVSLIACWYAQHGQPAADVAARRARAPWYRTKRTVSVADMLAALRRVLLAAQYRQGQLDLHILDLCQTPCLPTSTPPHDPGTRERNDLNLAGRRR
jgi:hypothetical protein